MSGNTESVDRAGSERLGLCLSKLAQLLEAELRGDPDAVVDRVEPVETAGDGSLTFLSNRRYFKHLSHTRATAVILAPRDAENCPVFALVVDNPYLGYARAAAALNPEPPWSPGIHPSAVVAAGAQIAASAWVGPQVVVEEGVLIGERVRVGPGSVLGAGARLGDDAQLAPNVTIGSRVEIGKRVLLHPGAVIGADGFGIANDDGIWVKVPQLGTVVVGDDVEIGANSTVDRGALGDTVIEHGVKIDNLVQVGHNVIIGAHTAVAGCVGIAGSVRIGRRCTIGGGAGISGHIELADDVHLTGATLVHRSIKVAGVYSSGMVAQENTVWRKNTARLRQLDDMARRLRALEDDKR